jgi:nitrogen fixation-related uncharacterized protein
VRPNIVLTAALIVIALACLGLAIFYWTTPTSLFASDMGIHHKHAILFTVLAVLALIAANFTRRMSPTGAAR